MVVLDLRRAYGEPTHVGPMWATLYQLAREAGNAPEGGTNYVHSVIQFNEAEGRTQDEVLALMEAAAVREAIDAMVAGDAKTITDAAPWPG